MLTVFVMVLLPSLLYVALRSSGVQTWLTGKAADYLSRELDARVSVGGVNVTWFMNLVLEDITVHDQRENPLLYAKRLVFDVNSISFTRRTLLVNKLLFDQASLGMVKYRGEENLNFQFVLDYFDKPEPSDTLQLPNWDLTVRSFEFRNSGLTFHDQVALEQDYGFNAGNFAFGDLNLTIEDIFYENDTLFAGIKHFSVIESKGLEVKGAEGVVLLSPRGGFIRDLKLETSYSQLEMEVVFSYESYKAFSRFTEDVQFEMQLKPSSLRLYELSYFFPAVYGLDNQIDFAGKLSGTISSLRGQEMVIRLGSRTNFRGNFNMVGLPDLDETFLNFSVERLITTKRDIESFRLPDSFEKPFPSLPKEIENLGLASFSGNFTGFFYDFVAYGKLTSALGEINTDIAIVSHDNYSRFNYRGSLASPGFNLGALLGGNGDIGRIAFHANLAGSGHDLESLRMDMDGVVNSLDYKGYDYRNIAIAGNLSNKSFNGNLLIDDPNLKLDFKGLVDFNRTIPYLSFSAKLEDANLSLLNIYQRDSLFQSIVSTTISVEGSGNSISDIEGELLALNTVYHELDDAGIVHNQYATEVISLEHFILENEHKTLNFTSDFLDINVEGEIYIDKMKEAFTDYLANYAPARYVRPTSEDEKPNFQEGGFQIHFKNSAELTAIWLPELTLAPDAKLEGYFNNTQKVLTLKGGFDYISWGINRMENLQLNIASDADSLFLNTTGSRLLFTDSIWVEQFHATGTLYQDTLDFFVRWDNESSVAQNKGFVQGMARAVSPQETEIQFLSSYAYLNDSLWTLRPGNRITLDEQIVRVDDFYLYKNNEFLQVQGVLSQDEEDILEIELNDFNLESLAFLLQDRKVDFAGYTSGTLLLSNLQHAPNITANVLVKDFAFNHDHLGDLSVNSNWDATEKAFKINAEVIYYGNVGYNKPLIANGYFYPDREHDNFDLDILIENLRMSVFARYVEGFASNFRGLASGRLRLDGPIAAPELSGTARLVRTGFRVDYTNIPYSFAHEVEVGKDYFSFENLTLNDTLGNNARVTGIIRHNNFFDFSLDISFLLDRMAVLNTRVHHNELFYGRAFASGLFRVHGPVNNIVMDISAQANRGTQIFLPLDYTGELTESSFISFVSPEAAENGLPALQMPQISGLSMNFDLEVTPEAEIQIIFDSQIGDILRGRGFGDLSLEINNQGAFNMYGDYTLQEGDYLFTLQNLINKRFRMEQGGTIRWTGDPYDADIDIRALYRLRTSLYDLAANQTDTSDLYRRRVPVETVLHLQDKLFNPTINFDIQLPGADESAREMIERIITTEQEMNRQVFSLLILNRFVPPEEGFNTALGYGMGSTSSELLSNQLSNWLSQISSELDIGINYRPGDEISSQEIEVALSTQLFDDRVIIDGNVGYAGDHPAQTQRASNIIGDVNVEVKITPEGKFRIKAFNRSNTFDVLNTNAPYTQGVGVFYRREFDNLSELFRRSRRSVQEIPEVEIPEYQEVEVLDENP